MATEGVVLWGISTYALWTADRSSQQVFLIVAAVAVTVAIASVRIGENEQAQPLLSSDRPVGKNDGDDDLDRTRIADSLVERVVADDIPVLAIVGAFGDGKTTLLEIMAARLAKRDAVIVRFKSSLPGDESALVASLFNSIANELHHRFFVRRLRNVLSRYAHTLVGVIPSLPEGQKKSLRRRRNRMTWRN